MNKYHLKNGKFFWLCFWNNFDGQKKNSRNKKNCRSHAKQLKYKVKRLYFTNVNVFNLSLSLYFTSYYHMIKNKLCNKKKQTGIAQLRYDIYKHVLSFLDLHLYFRENNNEVFKTISYGNIRNIFWRNNISLKTFIYIYIHCW